MSNITLVKITYYYVYAVKWTLEALLLQFSTMNYYDGQYKVLTIHDKTFEEKFLFVVSNNFNPRDDGFIISLRAK